MIPKGLVHFTEERCPQKKWAALSFFAVHRPRPTFSISIPGIQDKRMLKSEIQIDSYHKGCARHVVVAFFVRSICLQRIGVLGIQHIIHGKE